MEEKKDLWGLVREKLEKNSILESLEFVENEVEKPIDIDIFYCIYQLKFDASEPRVQIYLKIFEL